MRIDVSVWQMDLSIRNGCAYSNRMYVSIRGQPILVEWMCLLGERMCLFGKVAYIRSRQMCLFGRVAPIIIESFPLIHI